jgi:hypothetical protein
MKMSKAQMNKAFGGILGETEKKVKLTKRGWDNIQSSPGWKLVKYVRKDKTPTPAEFRRWSSKN